MLLIVLGLRRITILLWAMYDEGSKLRASRMNAADLIRGVTMAVDFVLTNMKSRAKVINTLEEIAQVAHSFLLSP